MKKNERLLLAMSMAEEAYVTEADPSRKVGMKKNGRKLGVAVAVAAVAVCMAVASLGIWLFIPYGDDLPEIEPYRDSEYYHVIQSLALYYG